jgi:Leucine-rich repeat (LRR) protein
MKSLPILFGLPVLLFVSACSQDLPAPVSDQGVETAVSGVDPDDEPETKLVTSEDFNLDVIHKALASVNSNYNGRGQFNYVDGFGFGVQLGGTGVVDLSPLKGLSIVALDLQNTGVYNLEPLRGMPIQELFLEKTLVEDLSPLANMPLQKLYLSESRVKNIGALKGAPLVELNLLGTGISDLSPLEGAPLQMLWLTDSPVVDISPLKKSPLVSLTLHRTQVKDLSPLAGTQLQRLHIGETPVSDLTPLKDLPLTRLIFTPENITTGMEIIPRMPYLSEIGTTFETRMDPNRFWIMYSQSKNSEP